MKKAVFISCFDEWHNDRLKPITDYLKKNEIDVISVASDFNHHSKEYISSKDKNIHYIHVPQYKTNISIKRIISHLVFARGINKLIQVERPDLIYLLMPPNRTGKMCMKYRKMNTESRLLVDIIDLWPESLPLGITKHLFFAKIWKNWRNNCISVADCVFTECNLYQEYLAEVINNKSTRTIYLSKEQKSVENQLTNRIINDYRRNHDTIKLAYLGSMNNIIDIDGIVEVVRTIIMNGINCELHAIGDGSSRELFEKSLKAIGCKTFFYGKIYDEIKKIEILAPCDFALNMMKDSSAVGLTIKSIDYFSFGLPLINNIKGDTWNIVMENSFGINIQKDNINYFDFHSEFDHMKINSYFNSHFTTNQVLQTFIEGAKESLLKLGIYEN